MPPFYEQTATGLARRIRDREISPVDVIDEIIDRIQTRNDRTNAFITITEERAREAARTAEHDLESGDSIGPLHGVPVAIKDLEPVKGVRTTYGSKLFENNIADENAIVVDRLESAGAIVVGKTNTPEFGLGVTTDNLVVGPTGSPFDPTLVAGGSSGGAGAALGDRLVPLAQGSDTGGSIRIPAAFCGVFGLKPSFGRVPRARRPDAFTDHTPFSHTGPMARTVEDAAVMLDVIAGSHARDPFSLPSTTTTYQQAIDRPIDDLHIAVSPKLGTYPVESPITDTIHEAIRVFEDAEAQVEVVDPPFGCDNTEILEAFYTYARVKWEALMDGLETDHGFDLHGKDQDKLRPITVETILESEPVSTREYKAADRVRTQVFDGIQDILTEYDLLVSATVGVLPFPHGESPSVVAGEEIEPLRGWVLTQPFNFSGHPTASIPGSFVDGLPVGMQITGRRHADAMVLSASASFERHQSWHEAYPA